MSFFTPADAEYIKGSVRKIVQCTARVGIGIHKDEDVSGYIADYDAELARLESFIDGCTLNNPKGANK